MLTRRGRGISIPSVTPDGKWQLCRTQQNVDAQWNRTTDTGGGEIVRTIRGHAKTTRVRRCGGSRDALDIVRGRSVPPEPPPDTRDVHSRHPRHQTRLHSRLSPTHECDHTHRRLAALTRTATAVARCQSQAEEHLPCRGARMRERAGTESLGESCDTGERSVGAKMPWRMGGRSVRPDCLRGVDVPGMKVQGAPARHRPVRPLCMVPVSGSEQP